MSLLKHAPQFDSEAASKVAADFYHLECLATSLPSERDQNFLITTNDCNKYVLKIANSLEQRSLLEAQNSVLTHLNARVAFSPKVIPASSGASIVEIQQAGALHFVRLVSYIEGAPLATTIQSDRLLVDFGKKLGQLSRALKHFDEPAFHRDFHWDLANGLKILDAYADLLTEELDRVIVAFKNNFEKAVGSRLINLPRSVIHGDANDYNVIVNGEKVVGLIDLGDMVWSYTIGELAIALAYVVLDKPDPLRIVKTVMSGYASQCEVSDDELRALWWLMLMRLAMSVCLAAHQQKEKPENEYLDISQQAIHRSLPGLLALDPEELLGVR